MARGGGGFYIGAWMCREWAGMDLVRLIILGIVFSTGTAGRRASTCVVLSYVLK